MSGTQTEYLDGYLDLFGSLTAGRVSEFEQWTAPEIRFRDPFNDVTGRAAMQAILLDMFERAEQPRFDVRERVVEGKVCYVRWTFTAGVPVIGDLNVDGASRLELDASGRVVEHLDYWDSAPIYLRLPLLGALLRRIKARMAHP